MYLITVAKTLNAFVEVGSYKTSNVTAVFLPG